MLALQVNILLIYFIRYTSDCSYCYAAWKYGFHCICTLCNIVVILIVDCGRWHVCVVVVPSHLACAAQLVISQSRLLIILDDAV